jgi:hypothetical protein
MLVNFTINNIWNWCDVNLWKVLNIVYFIKYENSKLLGKYSFIQYLLFYGSKSDSLVWRGLHVV